jgi:hypothetical protein
MHFKIETTLREDDIQDNCERCGKELDDLYSRNALDYDLVVLKCPQCKAIYAYLIDCTKDDDDWSDLDNSEPMNDHSAPRIKNPEKVLPKKCAAVYSKAISQQEDKTKELNKLIEYKLPELYRIGLSLATINLARSIVAREINAGSTTKHLTTLLAAAIYAKANGVTTSGSLWQHKGEGITERQLEEIFGVSRKTIRKWAEKFTQDWRYC